MRLRNPVVSFEQRDVAGRDLSSERFAQHIFTVEQLGKPQARPHRELGRLHDAIGARHRLRDLIGKSVAAIRKRVGQIDGRLLSLALKRESRSSAARKQAEQERNNGITHRKAVFTASAPRADGCLTAIRASTLERAHASYFWRKE